jgi:Xaa-Pro aminopeptidase
LPHGKASEKKILSGELVTIDFGAVYKGYNSDETVTVSVGEPDKRQREIYQIVKDAHDLALEFLRPGVTCKEIDAKARDHIEGKGLGRYFGHGLGHGVGIDIHEKPVISFRSETVVEEGMVFTIEPGIYLPGWGGVRIEDTVCVTGDGCRVMTKVCKDLLVL